MERPKNYSGPMDYGIPEGYVDVTCLSDKDRKAIPGMDHPYYVLRKRILDVLLTNACSCVDEENLTDLIMDAL